MRKIMLIGGLIRASFSIFSSLSEKKDYIFKDTNFVEQNPTLKSNLIFFFYIIREWLNSILPQLKTA